MHVQCLGAAGRVTGSCHLIEANGYRILLDCGLIQGSRKEHELNREPFPIDVRRIDAVILSHAHIDHSGRIPLLVRQGYAAPIYAHTATRALCDILLKDSGSIHEQEAERYNHRHQGDARAPLEPLYTVADAELAMQQFRSVGYHRKFAVTPGIRVRFRDAGHILGSCIVEVWLSENGLERKLVFSGDLGHSNAPLLRDPETVSTADLVLMESTYGDRDHRSWDETRAEVEAIVDVTRTARGNILIPAFAVGRTQLLLYWMARNFRQAQLDRWQIILDSPLAIRATNVYSRYISLLDEDAQSLWQSTDIKSALPNLRFTRTANQSRALNQLRSGAIIIAGSGMCTGGRIRHHLARNISRPECHVIIAGYQAAGTPGRALVEGARQLRLFGEVIPVRAKIHTIGGLSAHAGQSELLAWYAAFERRPPVILVHGEPKAQSALRELIRRNTGGTVQIAREGECFDMAQPAPFFTPG